MAACLGPKCAKGALLSLWCLHLLLGSYGLIANVKPCTAPWMQPVALEAPEHLLSGSLLTTQSNPAVADPLLRMQRRSSMAMITGTWHAAHIRSSSSSSGSSRQLLGRQLTHLDGIDTVHAADAAAFSTSSNSKMMYPRDSASVHRLVSDALRSGQAPFEIPVWFVIVVDSRNPTLSNMTQQQAEQQVQLLNRAFTSGLSHAGVTSDEAGAVSQPLWRFRLMGVRYSSSIKPMCIGSKTEEQVKAFWHPKLVGEASRSGATSDRTMIIYTTDLTAASCKGYIPGYKALFGWSNTPMELQVWKKQRQGFRDGVVLDFRYVYHDNGVVLEAGNKAMRGATTGAQLVHEVGHWMGLLHTFVGGCSNNAAQTDGVEDTAAEAHPRSWSGVDLSDASGGCQVRDSCPGMPGVDPWDNYMNYNNLACARQFTLGQQARMLYVFRSLRASRN